MIVKIQSISDLITNSSSEVFINKQEVIKDFSNLGLSSSMIKIHTIDWEWLAECRDTGYRWTFICDYMGWNKEDFGHFVATNKYYSFCSYWDQTEEEFDKWKHRMDEAMDEVLEALKGYAEIEITDHYDIWEDDVSVAKRESIYYASCH